MDLPDRDDDDETLAAALATERRPDVRKRLRIIQAAKGGTRTYHEIAEQLQCSTQLVYRWIQRYSQGGLTAVCGPDSIVRGPPNKLNAQQRAAFVTELKRRCSELGGPIGLRAAQHAATEMFNVEYSHGGMRALLEREGILHDVVRQYSGSRGRTR